MSIITKDNFTIKDQKTIDIFNQICKMLKEKNNFEDRFICLYKKLGYNYDKLKKLVLYINQLYETKIKEGYTKEDLSSVINEEDISFINDCIKEHDDFSLRMKEIIKVNSSYVKTTIKEKADLYIRKILPIFEDNGVLDALEEIINNDNLPLITLNGEYFDSLVYFALVDDTSRLKNSNFYLRDLFNLSKIIMCYDLLLNRVHKDFTCPDVFGDDKERIINLSNKARYINGYKPVMVSSTLNNLGLESEQIKENISIYISYYEKCEKDKLEQKREKNIVDLENEIEKCSIIVRRFIDSKFLFLDEYFTTNKVDKKKFNKALEILEEHNHPTYKLYLEKMSIGESQIDFEKMLNLIKNGIMENGKKIRDFDLVDYYEMASIPLREAKRIANKKLEYNDYLIISNFHKKYSGDSFIVDSSINNILKMSISYPIDGGVYTASDDDKRYVLLYLSEHNIPLTQFTYKIMLRRYVMDKLKEKTKQKKNDTQ